MELQTQSDRRAARWTGVFYIIATVLLFVGQAFYQPILDAPDVLQAVRTSKATFVFGVLTEFLCALAIPMIAVSIYPILKRFSEPFALAYLLFRILEAVLLIGISHVNKLALVGLSETQDATTSAQALAVLQAQSDWAGAEGLIYNAVFVIGAAILYSALYQTRLVPRFLSIWGFAALLSLSSAVVASIFVELSLFWTVLLLVPIAVQEMVLALWLIRPRDLIQGRTT